MALDTSLVGATASASVIVEEEHFASNVFEGAPDVFSTPSLGALVEATAGEWLQGQIAESEMSVGSQLVINHTAATPPGLTVTATVTLEEIDKRQVEFSWTATDDHGEVGNGTHQRFVLDKERFEAALAPKREG